MEFIRISTFFRILWNYLDSDVLKIIKIISILLLLLVVSCGEQSKESEEIIKEIEKQPSQRELDSIACVDSTKFYTERYPEIKYKAVKIENWKQRSEIVREWDIRRGNFTKYKALVTLNRKEINQMRLGDTILIPDSVMDQKAYSCFPQYYCGAKDIPKIIIYLN